mgnify:CR=1 FL=1|tara:strand:- start:16229 stop:17392 length:1164 start_codon:yes stop_codon:yes gene_type:complete
MIKKILKVIAWILAVLVVIMFSAWYWFQFTLANTLDSKFYGRNASYLTKALSSAYGIAEYSPLIETQLNLEELKKPACIFFDETLTLKECIFPHMVDLSGNRCKGYDCKQAKHNIAHTRPLQLPYIRRTPQVVWFHEFVLDNKKYKDVLFKVLENPCNYFNSLDYNVDKKAQGSYQQWQNYRCSHREGRRYRKYEVHFMSKDGELRQKEKFTIDFAKNYQREQSYYGQSSYENFGTSGGFVSRFRRMLAVSVKHQGQNDRTPEMKEDACKVMGMNFPKSKCIRPSFSTLDKPQKCNKRVSAPCISLTAHEYLKTHEVMEEYKFIIANPCEGAKKYNKKKLLAICEGKSKKSGASYKVKPVNVIFDFIDDTGHVVSSEYFEASGVKND